MNFLQLKELCSSVGISDKGNCSEQVGEERYLLVRPKIN